MISKKVLASALMLILFPLVGLATSSPLPRVCLHDCKVGSAGFILIKTAEGYSPFIYKDSVGIPTIGFGHVVRPGEKIKTPLMGPDALSLLEADIRERTQKLNLLIKVPLTSNQFDALASFAYNVGLGTFQQSSVLRRVNAEKHDQVPDRIILYDKAGGKVLKGLYIRRRAEAELYDDDDMAEM